jgi:oxygen-independent coproporphyrinogen III oxidase
VYCDFSIAVRRATPVREYLSAIERELVQVVPSGSWTLDTLYLGGGTPSRLGGEGVRDLIDTVKGRAELSADCEITIEANPEDVTPESAGVWATAGVNRVSLGIQSFDDAVLAWMHRSHTGAGAIEAVRMLRNTGIENISVDLIFALPESLNRTWADDLEKAIELGAPHVSVYGLTVEPLTPLARWVSAGSIRPGEEDPYAEEFLLADKRLSAAGYSHYEVSNYARDGKVSRHNSAYWTGAEYIGVGPSAHSFIGGERRWNTRAYEEWKNRILAGRSTVEGSEILTDDARAMESIYLGLRTSRGFRHSAADTEKVQRWVDAGWGCLSDDVVRLNASGWLRLDALAADLGGAPSGRNYISSYGSSAA